MKKGLIIFCFLIQPVFFVFAQIITTVAGNGKMGYTTDGGLADTTEISLPFGVAVDRNGNIYFTDTRNYRIRKVNTSGIIITIAGNGVMNYAGDGGPATAASFVDPEAIVVDSIGNIYIAENSTNIVRKIDTAGIINRFAGNGSAWGFAGDGGPATAAEIWRPTGLAIDKSGNIYIADQNNNRIRIVNTSGIINTIVGGDTVGFSGDGGPATAAKINNPTGVCVDISGNLYFTDMNNQRIRKINTSGIISTIAGNGLQGFAGDGGPATTAELNVPLYVENDAQGNIYISDNYNQRIRKINTSGIISTLAGDGVDGYSGDGGPATSAEISYPMGLTTDLYGNIYFADGNNSRIRKVIIVTGINEISQNNNVKIYPNPSNGSFTFELHGVNQKSEIEVYNMMGEKIYNASINLTITRINLSSQSAGIYLYRVTNTDGNTISAGKFVIE